MGWTACAGNDGGDRRGVSAVQPMADGPVVPAVPQQRHLEPRGPGPASAGGHRRHRHQGVQLQVRPLPPCARETVSAPSPKPVLLSQWLSLRASSRLLLFARLLTHSLWCLFPWSNGLARFSLRHPCAIVVAMAGWSCIMAGEHGCNAGQHMTSSRFSRGPNFQTLRRMPTSGSLRSSTSALWTCNSTTRVRAHSFPKPDPAVARYLFASMQLKGSDLTRPHNE